MPYTASNQYHITRSDPLFCFSLVPLRTHCIERATCQHGTGTSNSSDGILNINNLNAVRLVKQTYVRETHLLITDMCIERDSWPD